MAFFKWVSYFLWVLCLFGSATGLVLSESISSKFLQEANESEVFNRMVEIRRQIHEHPETGYEEINTSKLVRDELDSLKIPSSARLQKPVSSAMLGMGKSLTLRLERTWTLYQSRCECCFLKFWKFIMINCATLLHDLFFIIEMPLNY